MSKKKRESKSKKKASKRVSNKVITGVDVIGGQRIERKVTPVPVRKEKLVPIDLPDGQWRQAISRAFERVQSAVETVTMLARTCPLFADGGHLTEELSFTSGTAQVVKHGLGRPFKGFFVVDAQVAAPALYRVANDSNSVVRAELDKVQIKLHPTATFTARIWIY